MSSYCALVLLLCAIVQSVVAITDGLLPNGNFEKGPSRSELRGTRVLSRFAIPKWEISGVVDYIESGNNVGGGERLPVPEGAHAVRLGDKASVAQNLSVKKGTSYSITFSVARTCAQNQRLSISVGPHSVDVLPTQTVYSISQGWDSYAWAFSAASDQVQLVIGNPDVGDEGCGPIIDAVAIKFLPPVKGDSNENLIKNGDFEQGPYILPSTKTGVLIAPGIKDVHSPLSGWTAISLKAVRYIDSAHFKVPHGHHAVELVGGLESSLSQVANGLTIGQEYKLTFSVGDGGSGCKGPLAVEAFAGRGSVKVPYDSNGTGGFKQGQLLFTAVASRIKVLFYSSTYQTLTDGSLCGPVIDDVVLIGVHKESR